MKEVAIRQKTIEQTVTRWKWMSAGFGLAYGSITAALGLLVLLAKVGIINMN